MYTDQSDLTYSPSYSSKQIKLLTLVLFFACGVLIGGFSVFFFKQSNFQKLGLNTTLSEPVTTQQHQASAPYEEPETYIYRLNKNQSKEFHTIEINGKTGLINAANTHSRLHTDTSFSDSYSSLLDDPLSKFNVSDIVFASDDTSQYAVILDFLTYGYWGVYLLDQDFYTRSNHVTFLFMLQELYSTFTLLDYFPSTKQVLVTENGDGDSCGGTGAVLLFSANGISRKISDFAVGCALDPHYKEPNPDPVYLGYMKGKLYFSEAQGVLVDGEWDGNQLTQIFTIDPLTNVRANIDVDLFSTPIESGWRNKVIDSSTFVIGYDSNENAVVLDVDTLQFTTLSE